MIEHTFRALARRCDGPVLRPTDPAYDEARTLFNATIAAAIGAAREAGLPLAVRGGGHSVAGMSVCDGGIVCDLRRMGAVDADPARRLARAGGGATWAAFDRATQAHGLAAVGGRVSSTGVAGLTLGGGSGWLERRFGLACDGLEAVELVTAGGEVVEASAERPRGPLLGAPRRRRQLRRRDDAHVPPRGRRTPGRSAARASPSRRRG